MKVEQSELDDAHSVIRQQGFDEGNFVFERTPYRYLGDGVAPLVADMTVTNTTNGMRRTYNAGHGSSWPAEFSDDLRAGLFGARL